MAVLKQLVGTRTALSISSVATLASATYVASQAYIPNTANPVDVMVEVQVSTTNVPSGNKQLVCFVIDSLDGTNFRSGPTSGTTATDEADLKFLGVVPCATSAGTRTHVGIFSVANACGYVPHTFQIVLKNDLGVAMTGGAAFTAEVSMTIT